MKKLSLLLAILILSSGCTYRVVNQQPSYSTGGQRVDEYAHVVVETSSRNFSYSVRSMRASLLNRWDIQAGEMFMQTLDVELPQFFRRYDLALREQWPLDNEKTLSVIFKLEDYKFGGSRAQVVIHVLALDENQKVLLNRKYEEMGEGYGGRIFWGGAFAMKSAVRLSTVDAYKKAMVYIRQDLGDVLYRHRNAQTVQKKTQEIVKEEPETIEELRARLAELEEKKRLKQQIKAIQSDNKPLVPVNSSQSLNPKSKKVKNTVKNKKVEDRVSKIKKDPGLWRVSTSISDIDDSTNVILILKSEGGVFSRGKKIQPTLFIRCAENRTQIYVDWDVYLGLDETTMLHRLDSEKAKTTLWDISTDTKAVFFSGSEVRWAKELMNHEKLLLKITPYNETPIKATFNLHGLAYAIKPLRESCVW